MVLAAAEGVATFRLRRARGRALHLAGTFTDPNLPADYAPFNVAAIGGKLYVAYAKQDVSGQEEVAGPHRGFIDVFDLNGNLETRLVSGGALNAPWAMVLAPARRVADRQSRRWPDQRL
jgi:uncharacterized protein (TIGR03118 family)